MDPWQQPRPSRGGLSDRSRAYIAALLALVAAVCVLALDPGDHGSRFRRLLGLEHRLVSPVTTSGEGSYAFFATQPGGEQPVAWNPCAPIRYVVNPACAPAGWERLVDVSIDTVSEAAGLRFEYGGTTDDRDFSERVGFRGAEPVLIGWAEADEVPDLADEVAGLGGPVTRTNRGVSRYVSGMVVLDQDSFAGLAAEPDGAGQQQAIVLHELGHLVGLDHVDDPGELMYAENIGRTTFGPGDLTGLALLGGVPCG